MFRNKLATGLTLAALFAGCGISEGPSLISGPATKSTKEIKIKVAVDWTMSTSAADAITFTPQAYLMKTYAPDAGNIQVAVGVGKTVPTMEVPVTLQAPSLEFDATVLVPTSLNPRSSGGYAFRFELVPQSSDSNPATAVLKTAKNLQKRILGNSEPVPESIVASEETQLISFNANVLPGTDASANLVPLSLATTFAYAFLAPNVTDITSPEAANAFENLVNQFKARQELVEGSIDSGNQHSFAAYVAAIVSGIKYEVLSDTQFQSQVANSILNVIVAKTPTAQINSATESFAQRFTTSLLGAAQDVTTVLGNASGAAAQVFNTSNYTAAALPDPDNYSNVVFAPAQMTFTDTDAGNTLAGDIQITPPSLTQGVVSYKLYIGDETRGSSRGTFITEIPAAASTMTYTLTTRVQTGSRFWAYPVANGSELNIPSSVVIYNWNGGSNPPSKPTGLSVTAGNRQVSVSWPDVSGADSYNLYYGTRSPLSGSSAKITGVSSPYFHMGLVNGQQYYYAFTVVKDGKESRLSDEENATPNGSTTVVAPPAPLSLAATGGSDHTTLTWTPVSGATSYNVYFSETSPVTFSSQRIMGVPPSPYTHEDLTDGTYYYKITAVKGGVESALSNQASATVAPEPELAELTAEGVSTTQIDLSWSTISGPTQVMLVRKQGNAAPANCTDGTVSTVSNANSYSVTGLSASTQYSFVLCANVSGTNMIVSNSASATTESVSLAELTSEAFSDSEIDLSWSTISGPTDLTLVRKQGSTAPTSCTDGTVSTVPNTNSYSVTGLTALTQYSFVLCAEVSGTNTIVSDSTSATTESVSLAELTSEAFSDTEIDLSWSTISGPAFLTLVRKQGSTAPSSCTDGTVSTVPNTNGYSVPGLSPATTYSFVLCADVSGTNTIVSDSTWATTNSIILAELSSEAISDSEISLSWSTISGTSTLTVVMRGGSEPPATCNDGDAATSVPNEGAYTYSGLLPATNYSFVLCNSGTVVSTGTIATTQVPSEGIPGGV